MPSRESGFTYSACELFTINKKIVFNIAKNPKYVGYQRGFASMVYKFFDKKTSGSGTKNENLSKNYTNQLLENLKKSKLTFYRQYLSWWSCWYAINNQI